MRTMHVKQWWWLAVVLLLAIGIAFALKPLFLRPVAPLSIVIAQLHLPHSGLLQIAQAKGYFAEQRLHVTVRRVLLGNEAVTQVLRGEADVGTTAETPVARALAEGKQPKIIASIFSSRWISGIVVRSDHGITQPLDLKGKRIGYVFGTNTHYDLETFLSFHDIALASVTMVPGMPDKLAEAMLLGELDAVSLWIPYLTQLQHQLGDKATTFYPNEGFMQTVILVVRPDYVARHRDAIDRLLRALLKAEAFVETDPQQALAIIAAASNLDADVLRGHGNPLTYELTLKQSLLIATENQARWFLRRGLVPGKQPDDAGPDVLAAFETAPLRALKPSAVTVSK